MLRFYKEMPVKSVHIFSVKLTMENVQLAVNGKLMQGLELNGNLLAVGAVFVREAFTEASYRLWSIDDRHPAMIKVKTGGNAITLEI